MNPKQSHQQSNASPAGLLVHEQPSSMSINGSFLSKSEQNNMITPTSQNRQRKRLKFDNVNESDLNDQAINIESTPSEDNIEVQFHFSNCINDVSNFFKSKIFSYIYVVFLIIFLVNCLIQSAQISSNVQIVTQKFDLALQVFFTLTILVKLTQFQNQPIFWLTLDIVTNISGYLSFGLKDFEQSVRYFRAIKILRLLLIVRQSTYLHMPAVKLLSSLSSVGKILFPAVLFIYFYAVIGLCSFRDSEYTKCRDPANKELSSNWTVYSQQVFLCGQKECPTINGMQFECLNPIDFGVQPNPLQVKNIMQGYGLMRYSNIFYSLFSTFKQTFITGSSRLMILGKQVTNYFYVLIYYLSFIYLLAYIYLNIFYGLMITNEEEQTLDRRESVFQLRLNRASSKRKASKTEEGDNDEKQMLEVPSSEVQLRKISSIQSSKKSQNVSNASEQMLEQREEEILQPEQKQKFQEVIDLNNQSNEIMQSNKRIQPTKRRSKFYEQQSNVQQGQNQFEPQQDQMQQEQVNEQNLQKYISIMRKYYLINHIIVIVCSVNILIDWQKQTPKAKLVIDTIDFAFFWIYMAEMIFRMVVHFVYVPKLHMDRAGKIDFFIFCLCACGQTYEIATATSVEHFLMASDEISRLLRTIKYLRIFILISSTPYFNQARIIFNSTLQAVYSMRFLSGLWFLIMLTFSIMGYHMFNGKVKIDHQGHLDLQHGHSQHIGFEGIVDSFIYTVFIFYNEEWDYLLFEQYVGQSAWIVIWVLIVLVVGLQVLSKYFMAMLMKELGDKLNQQEELAEEIEAEAQQDQMELSRLTKSNNNNIAPILTSKASYTFKLKQKESLAPNELGLLKKSSSLQIKNTIASSKAINTLNEMNIRTSHNNYEEVKKQKQKKLSMMRDMILGDNQEKSSESDKDNPNNEKDKNIMKNARKKTNCNFNSIANYEQNGESASVQEMSWLQKLKMKLTIILKSRFYTVIRVCFIFVSIVCTLATTPLHDPTSQQTIKYKNIWYVTVAFFGLEIIVSVIAFGLVNKRSGYFRNLMNWVYFLVFVTEIISIIPDLSQNGHLQAILSFRILRIFVLVQLKYEADADMRLTMVGFWKLLPKVANLLAITIIMYGFFAIILVKLYKDDYYYCDGYEHNATINTEIDCMNWGGSWVHRKMNVSNILRSLLYLFLVATTEGWSTQVIESASLSGIGVQPVYGNNLWMEYFFSVFFFFGNMIMLNVFIGLSVNNFQKIKSQVTGLSRLSKDDKMWFSIKNTIYRLSPTMKDTPPDNCLSRYVHMFKNSYTYKIINIILFILFMINMSLYTTNMTDKKEKILDTILNVYIGIFIFEYVVSWVALGMRTVKHKKFIFETIGIVYFIIVFILTYAGHLQPKTDRILHGIVICFLAVRYFTLLNEVEFVRKMINSLLSIFPQTYNIWLLIFVTLFTYGVIGVYFFSYLKVSPQLNQFDQNYTNILSAIYALIKFSTLQSPILQIIDSTSSSEPNSVCFDMYSYQDYLEHGRMGCGNPVAGYIFFLSFHIIYSLILLSTLLAVIVDAYSEVRREQESMVNKFQLQEVQKEWENYDPQATGYIGYRDFWIFTAKLVKIYKVNKEELLSHDTKQSFLKSLQIPIYEDQNGVLSFQFHEVVQALTRIVLQQKMGPQWKTTEADKVFKNHHHHTSQAKMFKKSVYDSSHVLTLIVMKSGLKSWKRKAVNTAENQQNFHGLLNIAKREKVKAQMNNNQGVNNNTKYHENVTNAMNMQDSVREEQKQQKSDKNSINQSSKQKYLQSPLNAQRQQNSRVKKEQIQNVNFDLKKKTSIRSDEEKQKNLIYQKKSPMTQPQQYQRIVTAKDTYKVKSPRDVIKNVQSQRIQQKLNFNSKEEKKEEEDGLSQLEEIK